MPTDSLLADPLMRNPNKLCSQFRMLSVEEMFIAKTFTEYGLHNVVIMFPSAGKVSQLFFLKALLLKKIVNRSEMFVNSLKFIQFKFGKHLLRG